MNKVVVLNSGGFDSTVLIHYVKNEYSSDTEIYSLHFSYGQRSEKEELKWSEYNAKKVGAKIKNITLPPFDWTKSNFYNEGYEYKTQYLEWRNLIFLSYALSYAQAIGANKIFCAFLIGNYEDTSEKFLRRMNLISNIKIIAPFLDKTKFDLLPYAIRYKILPNHFRSCDVSNNEKTCGICDDCIAINFINSKLKIDSVFKAYCRTNNVNSFEFKDNVEKSIPFQFDVFWNEKCQLNCSHCYLDNIINNKERLSLEEFVSVTEQALKLGFSDISIVGKEPLFDDSIIEYIKRVNELRIKYPIMDFSLVTNGINLPTFAPLLKTYGLNTVLLSADSIFKDEIGTVRKTSNKILFDGIKTVLNNGLNLIVILSVTPFNIKTISQKLRELELNGVYEVKLAAIKPIGRANSSLILSENDLKFLWSSLKQYRPINSQFICGLSFDIYHHNLINTSKSLEELKNDIWKIKQNEDCFITDNFFLYFEPYCMAYLNYISLTVDGYILGCSSEYSMDNYKNLSAGNIKDYSLAELIRIGKQINSNYNKISCKCGKCPIEIYY